MAVAVSLRPHDDETIKVEAVCGGMSHLQGAVSGHALDLGSEPGYDAMSIRTSIVCGAMAIGPDEYARTLYPIPSSENVG